MQETRSSSTPVLRAKLVEKGFGRATPQDVSGDLTKQLLMPVERLISERMRRSASVGRSMRTSSSGDDLAQPTPSSSAEDLSRLIEAQQALRVSSCREADLRAEKEAEVLRACYQHVPVAGGRMPVRTEHTGISDHPSTRVHAAPGRAPRTGRPPSSCTVTQPQQLAIRTEAVREAVASITCQSARAKIKEVLVEI